MMIAANIISMTILFAVPLLLVAMGGMFSEHSGVINIALEGMMIIGAWNLHDWAEIYLEGIGWVPVDQSFGIPVFARSLEEEYFFLGGIDSGFPLHRPVFLCGASRNLWRSWPPAEFHRNDRWHGE
jgi:hypothetical protein